MGFFHQAILVLIGAIIGNYFPTELLTGAKQLSRVPIMEAIFGCQSTHSLLVLSRHKVFEFIKEKGSVTPADIAQENGWNERGSRAMLLAVASLEILHWDAASNSFSLSRGADEFLLAGKPSYVGYYLELFWDATPQTLLEKAQNNEDDLDANVAKMQEGSFMLGKPPTFFIKGMQSQSNHGARTLAPLLDLSGVSLFIDVGGGSGTLVTEMVRSHPGVKGAVYDLPGVLPVAAEFIAEAGLSDRIATLEGDMFKADSYPAADVYSFGNVLHDWPDGTNLAILKKAHAGLNPGGRVVIFEMLISEDVASTKPAAGLNVVMVTNEFGIHYTSAGLNDLLAQAGFKRHVTTCSPLTAYCITEGFK